MNKKLEELSMLSDREHRKRLIELEKKLAEFKREKEKGEMTEKIVRARKHIGSIRSIFSRPSRIFKDSHWLQHSAGLIRRLQH